MKHAIFVSSLWLVLANVLWAINYPFLKYLLPNYISPLALTTIAVATAAILAQIISPFHKRERIDGRDIPKIVVAGILMSTLRKFFLFKGLVSTSDVNGSILSTIGPLLVLIISLFLGKETLTKGKILGVLIGMGGAVMLILTSSSQGDNSSSSIGGDLYIIAGTLCSSLYITLFQPLIVKYRPITILRWMYGTSALILIPIGGWDVINVDFSHFSPLVIFPFIYAIVVPALFPNLIVSFSLKILRPTSVIVFGYIQPIVVATIAIVWGNSYFSFSELWAMAAIALGVMFVENVTGQLPHSHFGTTIGIKNK